MNYDAGESNTDHDFETAVVVLTAIEHETGHSPSNWVVSGHFNIRYVDIGPIKYCGKSLRQEMSPMVVGIEAFLPKNLIDDIRQAKYDRNDNIIELLLGQRSSTICEMKIHCGFAGSGVHVDVHHGEEEVSCKYIFWFGDRPRNL